MAFSALMHIGELTQPSSVKRHSCSKLTLWHSCSLTAHHYSFHLPYHKGDHFFDGNTILVEWHSTFSISAYPIFADYLCHHDQLSLITPNFGLPPLVLSPHTLGLSLISNIHLDPTLGIIQYCQEEPLPSHLRVSWTISSNF